MAPNLKPLPSQNSFNASCRLKSFLAIIDEPYFVSSHLSHLPENSLETRFLVYKDRSNGLKFEVLGVRNPYTPRAWKSRIIDSIEKPELPTMNPHAAWSNLVCSLDGLLLLSTTRSSPSNPKRFHTAAALWNPSIKRHRQLSLPSPEAGNFGLGYDPLSKDYKVVALHASRDQAWVYSVSTKSWTEIIDRRFREGHNQRIHHSLYSKSMFIKDRVVWIIERSYDDQRRSRRLAWFEFGAERFDYANEMPSSNELWTRRQQLVMLDGGSTIGVWSVDTSDQVFVWALGTDAKSWTLRYKLAPPHRLYDGLPRLGDVVVAIDRPRLEEKNGELVWKYWEAYGKTLKIVTYKIDGETQLYHKRSVGTVTRCLDIYIESLVMAS